ncbi:DNA invertase Pin-like site-specific DNA recombinase [Methanococcus voltae PS]|uniref:DNA invertase Pin-like site-specific DNA recombinase n=1 Tax=Methanococcus voltae PS TaxID=523842 RepID=A0ABT2EX84_METVO|nr:recombinase family protein [Methanococcus voltae]MCS3922580.1 DNA invertase Pin-like site-specific DNA recombinase [Methanococcus voltae PS]
MKIGYARVSTRDQNLERQVEDLKKAGCEKIFLEKISGTKRNRPEFDKMFELLRADDVLIVTELTRISRSTKDLVEIVENCKSLNVEIKSLKESWLDTSSAHGKLLFTIFAGLAQFERDLTSERTKNGLDVARTRGRVGGRPKVDKSKLEMAIKLYNSGNCTLKEIKEITGISKSTLYRYSRK